MLVAELGGLFCFLDNPAAAAAAGGGAARDRCSPAARQIDTFGLLSDGVLAAGAGPPAGLSPHSRPGLATVNTSLIVAEKNRFTRAKIH